jgi:replication factor C large subunit
MLTKKYSPKKLRDVIGQEEVARKIVFYIINYKKQKKKALLLHGPSGVGKTSLIYAIASELGSEIIELNSSDFRDKEKINSVLKAASQQGSFWGKGKIILVDEVEGINAQEDSGGWSALTDLFLKSNFPIILTTNDAWQRKLDKIRSKTEILPAQKLNEFHIEKILADVAAKEGYKIKQNFLKIIAAKSFGDARAAINDLESLIAVYKETKEINEISPDLIGGREREKSIFEILKEIFQGKPSETLDIFDSSNIDIDEIFMWIDENIPEEYQGKDLANAYEILSKADVFRGRIIRRQHWRFLVYIYALLSSGLCSAKKIKSRGFVSYKRPSRVLKMWIAKQGERKEMTKRLAPAMHCSARKVYKEAPYIEMFLNQEAKIQ